MTTLRGKSGRIYEIEKTTYGTRNHVYTLSCGGVILATTGCGGPHGESSTSLEVTLERAEKRADELGLQVTE